MLKLFAGNFKSAIDDITNVQAEGEWFIQNSERTRVVGSYQQTSTWA